MDNRIPVDIYTVSPIVFLGNFESCTAAQKKLSPQVKKEKDVVRECLNGRRRFFEDEAGRKMIAFLAGTPMDKVEKVIKQRNVTVVERNKKKAILNQK